MDGDEEEDTTKGRGVDDAAAAAVSDCAGFCRGDDGDICPEDAMSDIFGSLQGGDSACTRSTVSV